MATVDEIRAAAEKVRDLSGDIADTLGGWRGPGDELTYRGSLLQDLLGAALILRQACLAESPAEAERHTPRVEVTTYPDGRPAILVHVPGEPGGYPIEDIGGAEVLWRFRAAGPPLPPPPGPG